MGLIAIPIRDSEGVLELLGNIGIVQPERITTI